MPESLFRRKALEKLSSPEELDRLMQTTNPIGWLALITVGVLLLVVVLWGFFGQLPVTVKGPGILVRPEALRGVVTMAGGQVVEILVKDGQAVQEGTVVARIQPVDLFPRTARVDVLAPYGGRVAEVLARPGTFVQAGAAVLNLTSEVGPLEAVLFLPLNTGKEVRPGMQARLSVSTVEVDEYGYLMGTVRWVAEYNATQSELMNILGSEDLVAVMTSGSAYQAAPLEVRVDLEQNLSTASGYQWSSKKGPNFGLREGTLIQTNIVTRHQRPVDLVIPYLDKVFKASPW